MRAEIISIGTELLLGEITDTNATTIAQALTGIGIDLIFRTTVGDNEERIAQVIDAALNRVDIIITSGGLGPTVDDVTREAIARATGHPLVFQPALLEQIADRFRHFAATMSENNRRQAFVPQGALPIENPVGTAPIFILETERGVVMTLPGVPREMKYLLENVLIPRLGEYTGEAAVIQSRTLRTAGIGESQIDARIADLMAGANPTVGLAAHSGQTDIRITAKAKDGAGAQALIEPIERELRRRLGDWIYGTGTQPIEEVIVQMLCGHQASIGCLEAGTGGELTRRLKSASTDAPAVLAGHTVLETAQQLPPMQEDMPTDIRSLAETAARYARETHSATFGAAIILRNTGEGLVEAGMAVASQDRHRSRTSSWTAERTDASVWAATHCLALLRRILPTKPQDAS